MSAAAKSKNGRGKKRRRHEGNGFEAWGGYMQAKIQKLQEQCTKEQKRASSNIFSGVSIFVNGYTKPTSAELKQLVLAHGGQYHHYYSRTLVSHIVATNLPNSKVTQLTDEKVVGPDWITDSISAGKLLPYHDYLLYPSSSKSQPCLTFKKHTTAAPSSGLNETTDFFQEQARTIATTGNVSHHGTVSSNAAQSTCCEPVYGCIGTPSTSVSVKNVNSVKARPSKTDIPAKAGDRNFVAEFYSNSRLHHISTWGAELKDYVKQLQKKGDGSFPAREKLCKMTAEFQSDVGSATDATNRDARAPHGGTSQTKGQRTIMHIDMDSFFVSVGLRNHPHLLGKPVAVTHSSGKGASRNRPGTDIAYERAYWQKKRDSARGRGRSRAQCKRMQMCEEGGVDTEASEDEGTEAVQPEDLSRPGGSNEEFFSMAEIASCSYEARQAGVKNGMLMGEARKLCPALVPIHYDFDAYREVSQALYDTVASYTHDIEAVSCDEMLIDCTDVLVDTSATPLQFASLLRQEIREKTQCNASAGIAGNILLAKLATRMAKPNGQFHLLPEGGAEFIKDKSVSDLPGVGRATSSRLHAVNVHTCAQLQQVAMATLQKEFGPKTGELLYRLCRGEDSRCVTVDRERKSVSAEINYGIRFTQMSEVEKFLEELAGEVHNRLVKVNCKGRQITLKVKVRRQDAPRETAKFLGHGVCDNLAKCTSLPVATQEVRVIAKECVALVRTMRITPSDFRGVGIQVSRLETPSAGKQSNRTLLSFVTPVTQKDVCHMTTSVKTTSTGTKTMASSVAQQKTSPVLPPLPKLPDVSSPPARLMHPRMQQGYSEADNDVASDWLLPSPSQVDLDVLAELPTDIRQQLQKAMTNRQRSRPPGGSIHPIHNSEQPGCSHWPSDQQDESEGNASEIIKIMEGERSSTVESLSADLSLNSQPIVALPSYSQLDPGCLAALPSDLREELEHAYDQERNKRSMAPSTAVALGPTGDQGEDRWHLKDVSEWPCVHPLILEQAKSYNSPRKSPAKSPRRGTRVGRGGVGRGAGRGRRRTSPKKLQFDTRQTTIMAVSPQKGPEVISRNVDNETSLPEAVNLCGAVDFGDVKVLLSQWLQSSHSPVESDVEWIADYLIRLVNDLNLEMVIMVMRYIRRQMMLKDSHQWLTSYRTLTDHVQAVVCSRYGCMLKLQVTRHHM